MKKKILALAMVAAMALSLAACGGSDSSASSAASSSSKEETAAASSATESKSEAPAEESTGEKTKLSIGLAFPIMNDGMTNLSGGIIACLENNYPDYEIETTLTNADSDINKLISDVESLIAKNPDMIYIMNSIGDQGVIPAVKACIDAGIPVGIGVAIEGYEDYTFLYEGFSQYACGQMQAEFMDSIYDENAEYHCAVISGDAGNTAGQARSDGFIENFIDKHDNAELVIMGEGNWATDDSQALVDDWLVAYPEINVICCASDDEAQGAINACKAADRSDVTIVSIDATDLGKEAIKNGDLTCSIAINFLGVASMCADALVDCATGKLTGTGNQVVYTTENLEAVTIDSL